MAEAKQNNAPWLLIGIFGMMVWGKLFGESKEDKEGEQETDKTESAPLNKNPFMYGQFKLPKKPGYYRFTLTLQEATKAASQIQAGIGTFTDDESQIMAGLKKARTKADITYIVAIYEKLYKRDLYTDLKKNLNRKKELGSLVNKFVNKLPDYSKTGTMP